jgi:hypothetical protein
LIQAALAGGQHEAVAGLAPSSRKRLDSIRAEIIRAEQPLERSYEAFEQGKLSRLRLVTPALRIVRKSGPTERHSNLSGQIERLDKLNAAVPPSM